jgi:hypothetical protein
MDDEVIMNVEEQAKLLAAEHRKSDPDIQEIYWFPDDQEVRLVEISTMIPQSTEARLQPFYFRPSPADNLPVPSGIALIRPDEFGKLQLPKKWGDWKTAVRIAELK